MRERLGAQRDADELLAEASKLRGIAAADADALVAEAEGLAEQLLTEAREAADKMTTQAQERADGILARAYFEAEDLQRHTEEERTRIRDEVQTAGRAEIDTFRLRSAELLGGTEDGLRALALSLEDGVATAIGVLRSIEELRNGPSDDNAPKPDRASVPELAGAVDTEVGQDQVGQDQVVRDEVVRDEVARDEMVAEGAPTTRQDNSEARPLGWLFRTAQA